MSDVMDELYRSKYLDACQEIQRLRAENEKWKRISDDDDDTIARLEAHCAALEAVAFRARMLVKYCPMVEEHGSGECKVYGCAETRVALAALDSLEGEK